MSIHGVTAMPENLTTFTIWQYMSNDLYMSIDMSNDFHNMACPVICVALQDRLFQQLRRREGQGSYKPVCARSARVTARHSTCGFAMMDLPSPRTHAPTHPPFSPLALARPAPAPAPQVRSAQSAAMTPWVTRPTPPITGRGAAGNRCAHVCVCVTACAVALCDAPRQDAWLWGVAAVDAVQLRSWRCW